MQTYEWAPIRPHEFHPKQYFGYARLKALGSLHLEGAGGDEFASSCYDAEMDDAEAAWGMHSPRSDVGECARALREAVVYADCYCSDFDRCLMRKLQSVDVQQPCSYIAAVERFRNATMNSTARTMEESAAMYELRRAIMRGQFEVFTRPIRFLSPQTDTA